MIEYMYDGIIMVLIDDIYHLWQENNCREISIEWLPRVQWANSA